MPLPRRLLNDDEELLAEMRPHWVFYVWPMAVTVLAWVIVLAIIIGTKPPSWTNYPLIVIGAVPSVWLAGRLIRWRSYTLALTTTRIIVRQGILGRDTVQLRLQRITEINLSQSLPERMLSTGRLVIDVQGEDDSLVLTDVRQPAVVQRVLNAQINVLQGHGLPETVPESLRPRDARHHHDHDHDDDHHDHYDDTDHPTSTALSRDDTPPFGNEPVSSVVPSDPAAEPPQPSTPAATTEASVHEKLIELDDLRRRGILTEEEFQAKKAQLLDRI